MTWWLCLQVVSGWVTGGGYALGAETVGGNLPLSRVGLLLPGRIVTSLLHFHLAALTVIVAVVGGGSRRHG